MIFSFLFFFLVQFMKHPLIELFHLSNLLKCRMTIEWLTLSSLAMSLVVIRVSALMMFSVGCCQLPLVIDYAPHLQASQVSFAKLLEPPLHCTFISNSWTKFFVDVLSCLCCFTTHVFHLFFFNYENIITHLQETWQIQNKITYSSTTYYNCLF